MTYRVTSEGIPDTVTLTVVRGYGAEAATFRAAAQKVTAVCRFTPTVAGALLRQEMRFRGTSEYSDSETFTTDVDLLDETAELVSCGNNTEAFTQSGSLTLQMIIGVDGYPEPGSIHATPAAFPLLEREAQSIIAKCLFKPARYKGVPVREKIEFNIKVGASP